MVHRRRLPRRGDADVVHVNGRCFLQSRRRGRSGRQLRTDRLHGNECLGHRLDDGRRKEPGVLLYRRRADRHFRIHDVARQAEFRGLAAVHGAPGILVVRTIHLDDGRGEAGLGDV